MRVVIRCLLFAGCAAAICAGALNLAMLYAAEAADIAAPTTNINPPLDELVKLFEKREFTSDKGDKMGYRLLVPKEYDKNKKYPLTVFLHGSGESGDNNESQLVNSGPGVLSHASTQQKHPSLVLCPQCPRGGQWGYYHGDVRPAELMIELVRAVQKEYSVDPDRIYVTGLSLGGMGTWYAIAEHPDLFAAGLPICGAGDTSKLDQLLKTPIWALHGTADTAVPIAGPLRAKLPQTIVGSRDIVKAIQDHGGKAKITEYEGQGHGVWGAAYNDPAVIEWLFSQTKTPSKTGTEPKKSADSSTSAPGKWKNITPPGVTMSFENHVFCQGVTIDPKNPRTLYLCVCAFDSEKGGLFKTTDSGATWNKIGKLDEPLHLVIDPSDSEHLYCVDGVRGGTLGFWVSSDGGKTWSMPAGFEKATQKPVGTRDLYSIAVDPTDFKHILVSFHSPWADGKNCGVLESRDGGEQWIAHDPPPTLKGGYGMAVFFLFDPAKKIGDSQSWLFTAQEGGFFKTTDGGHTWTNVYKSSMTHGGNQLYRTKDGTLYSGGYQYPARSIDNGSTWEAVKTGLPYSWYMGICGDGRNLYTVSSSKNQPFFVSRENDGLTWRPVNDEKFSAAAFEMVIDPVNRILYSASWEEGLLALQLETDK